MRLLDLRLETIEVRREMGDFRHETLDGRHQTIRETRNRRWAFES